MAQTDVAVGWRGNLARNPVLRAIALPLLRVCDVPLTISNPFAGMPFHLRAYTHKGYWFYGKTREAATMARMDALLRRGDTVLEVGAHIGYLTQFFARKVGQTGEIHAFEPGAANQNLLQRNIQSLAQCALVDAAVSNDDGKAMFFEENLGGFMNSLDPEFASTSGLAESQRAALRITPRQVRTLTLDGYVQRLGLTPDFIKIDVEGAELAVLQGARQILPRVRAVMVEVSRDRHAVMALLHTAGFVLSDEDGKRVTSSADVTGNIFATRPD